jgi:hypothetical protein
MIFDDRRSHGGFYEEAGQSVQRVSHENIYLFPTLTVTHPAVLRGPVELADIR